MPINRIFKGITALIAAMTFGAPAAAASTPPEPGESSTLTAQTPTSISAPADSETLTGEHALQYLSQLAREELAAANSGTNLSDYPGGTSGTSNGTLTAAQKGEPVGAGGTSGGSLSPFALTSRR